MFGVLELITRWPLEARLGRITADYTLSLVEVLELTTCYILESTGNLDVLCGIQASRSPDSMPSWVQIWTRVEFKASHLDFIRVDWCLLYNSSNQVASTTRRNSQLLLQGVNMDTIAFLTDTLPEGDDIRPYGTYLKVLAFIGVKFGANHSYQDGAETWQRAYLRTNCADVCYYDLPDNAGLPVRRLSLSDVIELEAMARDTGSLSSSDAFNFLTSRMTFNRKLFVTKTGFLGLGPKEAKIGDEVFVLKGGRVPFVLRREEKLIYTFTKSRAEGGQIGDRVGNPAFTLIGDCYVHGIMDGEACSGDYGENIDVVLV